MRASSDRSEQPRHGWLIRSARAMPDGVVLMRVKNKRVSELAGQLHKKGRKPVPIELMSR